MSMILLFYLNRKQMGLDILKDYYDRWKLTVNVNKTYVMIFSKRGANKQNVKFDYNGVNIDIFNLNVYIPTCKCCT